MKTLGHPNEETCGMRPLPWNQEHHLWHIMVV